MDIVFFGDIDQFTMDFLREQYNQYPELLKQEMIMTANILSIQNEGCEGENEHLDSL